LASQIEPLRTKATRLDNANIALLYAAGVVALLIAGFAFWSSRVNRNLRELEADLSKVKEAEAKAIQQRVETNLAEQQERAAKAERALLELKERTKPRALSDAELNHLRQKLAAITDKGRIEIVTPTHRFPITDDAELFASQLGSMLKKFGWQVSFSQQEGSLFVGCCIQTVRKQTPPNDFSSASAITGALAQIGISCSGTEEINQKVDMTTIRLIVGVRIH
jgi:hypothetical protein